MERIHFLTFGLGKEVLLQVLLQKRIMCDGHKRDELTNPLTDRKKVMGHLPVHDLLP